jgi:peptidoglycan hydrolase-like protein with peptidoglycan-binding domain
MLRGADVLRVQRLLHLEMTGIFDDITETAVHGFQAGKGLLAHGEVDEPTARALQALATSTLIPEWYEKEERDEAVALRLGGCDEASIRRFQSAQQLPTTGVVDEETAKAIGD